METGAVKIFYYLRNKCFKTAGKLTGNNAMRRGIQIFVIHISSNIMVSF